LFTAVHLAALAPPKLALGPLLGEFGGGFGARLNVSAGKSASRMITFDTNLRAGGANGEQIWKNEYAAT
jgi:hypothetical protein